MPDEERNATVKDDNVPQIKDIADIATDDLTEQFSGMSVKACSPQPQVDNIYDVPVKRANKLPESFDDLPVKPREGKGTVSNDDNSSNVEAGIILVALISLIEPNLFELQSQCSQLHESVMEKNSVHIFKIAKC